MKENINKKYILLLKLFREFSSIVYQINTIRIFKELLAMADPDPC